ncbi:MAG: hypothetical protein IJ800_06705, partial [Clostridia bacterium]|nr:hypothetical protein [Clostridia bacterium]
SNEQCAYPKLLVRPAKTAAEYKAAGVTSINIPIYVSAKGLPEERKSKKFSFWKAGGGADDKYLSVGEWTVVSRTIDDLFSNEPDVNGDNTGDGYIIIFQMDNSADNDLNYEIYVGNIAGGNNLFPTIKNYTQKCRAEGTYVDNKTLLKVTIYEGDVNNSIKCYCYPGITKADMAGITSIKFRVYIDSSALSEKSKAKGYKEVCFLPHSEGKEVSVTNVEFDKWVEIEVSTEDLWKYYDTTYKVLPLLTAYNKDDEDKGYVYDENLVVYFDGFYAV